jgi:hypothetical protein
MIGAKSSIVAFGAIAIGAVVWMLPGSANAFFSAPLVQCQSVTVPVGLGGSCGTDPLTNGVMSIDNQGDLDISVSGAAANQTYTILFTGPGGNSTTLHPTLTTGSQGSGVVKSAVLFSLGKVGAGNLVLIRDGLVQFISGISIESNVATRAGADFRPELVSCSAVSVPAAISECGTDAFKNGQVEIDSASGDVNVQVQGAAASVTYTVVLRATDDTEVTLGSGNLSTNSRGNGQLTASEVFTAGTIGTGTVVLKRAGMDQAYSGFRVSQKPRPKAASSSGLVQCVAATGGGALGVNCGFDPLSSGSAVLNSAGVLKVTLTGAAPDTDYEVFFRPINSTGPDDVDTTIAITTDDNGNGKGSATIAPSGTVASGNFVVKEGDSDEFLTGFTIK